MSLSSTRLRRTAEKESRAAVEHWQSGSIQRALVSSRKAEQAVRALQTAEPNDVQHALVLGSVLYNQAAILAAGGAVSEGVRVARSALATYESLVPGIGPLDGHVSRDALRRRFPARPAGRRARPRGRAVRGRRQGPSVPPAGRG
ncbi:hypothetical protein AB0K80_31550 [Streptomyces sp. NPDC052682]|uniref:hypothetical protein n=1 Tax=Streptomyces sp. NPDC052682 TaxID=3154954 RepID=UPI003432C8D9